MNTKGQSLFEVVFAVGIAALIVLGIVALANRTLGNSNTSRDRSIASRYAQDMTDCLRELRDEDFDNFVSVGASTCRSLVSGTQFDTSDTTIDLTSTNPPDDTIYQADIVVAWEDGTGLHEVISIARFSDWRRQ